VRLTVGLGALAIVAGALLLGGVVPAGGDPRPSVATTPAVSAEIPVTPMDQSLGAGYNSPAVLADPTEPRFVVMANRLDAPDFSCALQVSGNAGRGWLPADPVPELPRGTERCYAPEVAFDRDGVLYYLFVGLAGEGNEPVGAFLTTSSDRARTFTPPRRVLGPLKFGVRMALDPDIGSQGRVHLVWVDATSDPPTGGFGPLPNPILTAHSDDGGKTFSKPITLGGGGNERVVGPALALGPDHAVHVAWYDLKDDARDYQGLDGPVWQGNWAIAASSSTDGGRSFPRPTVVDDEIVPHERVMLIFTMPPPSLAVQGKRLCAAWTDARYGDADAVLRCSLDGGRRWGGLRRLNDDARGNGRWQYMPRLAVSPGGRIDAAFYDRRRDRANLMADVYATYSIDGAEHFAPNLRLSSESFDTSIGQQYLHPSSAGLYEFGGRIGLLSRRHGTVVAWADTRNSRPDTTSQDLFASVVRLPEPEGGSTRTGVVGGALVGLGVLLVTVAAVVRRRRRSPSTPDGAAS